MERAVADRDERSARKEVKACMACRKDKPEAAFSGRMWRNVANKHRKCTECVQGARTQRGCWKCVQCKNSVEIARFSEWLSRRSTQKPDGKQRCNVCDADQERGRKRVADRSYEVLPKTKKPA